MDFSKARLKLIQTSVENISYLFVFCDFSARVYNHVGRYYTGVSTDSEEVEVFVTSRGVSQGSLENRFSSPVQPPRGTRCHYIAPVYDFMIGVYKPGIG